ncbi:MAG TPA: hypothetical protein P5150_08680, partial [Candidatus Ratteibacteria bacterium]|nr:hypothetical protein [Candidatus Ratteibacteria bacterium]
MKKFFIAVLVFFSFIFIGEAEITVFYKGLDKVHLKLNYASNEEGEVQVKVAETGESLFSQTTPGGWINISAEIFHEHLSNGTYTYQLWFNDSLKSSVSAKINGKIKGELLDDETINETAILEDDVIVPAGKNFTVNGSIVGEDLLKNNVYVEGTINFQNEIALKEVNIHFQGGSSSINEIEGNGTLIFYSSSSGSSAEKCKGQLGILIKKNTSVSISNSEIGWFGMEEQGTSLDISDSVILGIVNLTKIQGLKADGDIFMGQVTITGGSPKFEKCEFAYYVLLCNRNEGEFKECVFGTSLEFYDNGEITDVPKWVENSDIQPTFSGNSFVGRMGPVFTDNLTLSTPVNLGNNYYGDKKPLLADDTYYLGSGVQPGWFLTRGIPINKYHFKIEQWSKSGPEMKNQKK